MALVKKTIFMKDVAKAAGVSLMTVSYALRQHPAIPEATRRRIQEVADRLGYRRDPLISALMTRLRVQREVKDRPVVAYITGFADRRSMFANPFRRAYYEGAEARAEELGYKLELFLQPEYAGHGGRLSQVLRYREIQGVVLGITPTRFPPVELEWPVFAVCVLGCPRHYRQFHRVDANHAQHVALALRHLRELGYRRIGMLTGVFEDLRNEGAARAAITGENHGRRAGERIAFHVLPPRKWNPPGVARWVRQHEVEALLVQSHQLYHYLREAGCRIPGELAMATLEWTPGSPIAGVDPRPARLGAAAVDQVILQLQQNHRGEPSHRQTILSDGVWVDGATAPPAPLNL